MDADCDWHWLHRIACMVSFCPSCLTVKKFVNSTKLSVCTNLSKRRAKCAMTYCAK